MSDDTTLNKFDDVPIAEQSWAYQNLIGTDREWTPIRKTRTVTTSGMVNPLDDLVRVNATAGAVTMTLETAVGCDGRRHTFKLIDASGNGMVLDGAGSEVIDGATTLTTTTQFLAYTIISNGASWDVV